MVTPLAVGLVGAADALTKLQTALAGQSDCTVAAVLDCSHIPPSAGRPAEVQATAGFDQLLATGIDFVVLQSPLPQRLSQVQAAAAQGVHCLLESPMAPDLPTATAMVEAAAAAGIQLGVVVPGQSDPVYELLRRWLASDWLGGPLSMVIHGHLPGVPTTQGLLPLLQFTRWWLQREVQRAVALPDTAAAALLELGGRVAVGLLANASHPAPVLSLHGTGGSLQLDATGVRLCGRFPRHDALLSQPLAGEAQVHRWAELAAARQVASAALLPPAQFARLLDHRDDFPCLGEDALVDLQVLATLQQQTAAGNRRPG